MRAISVGLVCLGVLGAGARMAAAASGGGYSPSQQDCQAFDDDWATPAGLEYPGCHNLALNVESGSDPQGDASPSNTRYLEFGMDQMPVDPHSKGTPTLYSVGLPGNTGSPHAGCLAFNTAGTGGGAAPWSQAPQPGHEAEDTTYGCGNNPAGTGFDATFDYYQWYCPIAAAAGHPCEDPSYGTSSLDVDHGTALNVVPLIANGLAVYFGEDDNNDNTEHDGVGPYTNTHPQDQNDEGAENGPSDGGGMLLSVTPHTAARLPSLTDPEGLINYSAGFCADGICAEGTTQQQEVTHGCDAPDSDVASNGITPTSVSQAPCDPGTPQNADVFDYATKDPSVTTESAGCNSGDTKTASTAECGPGGQNAIRSAEPANEYAEPGVQLYADPDSSRSPALPSPLWPTPAVYAGTCGVTVGSPALPTAKLFDSTPLGNGAGQLQVSLPHC
ncbi:MAG TPA: hypothetical protein VL961_04750 [Acidimicrobiales bacterium]|nr:hypothetical protein [Acidimicrobiales bacterium]